jgi:hypothetical protein
MGCFTRNIDIDKKFGLFIVLLDKYDFINNAEFRLYIFQNIERVAFYPNKEFYNKLSKTGILDDNFMLKLTQNIN